MQTNQGLTLDRYLQKKSPLEPPQAARIALQIAQQMAAGSDTFLVHPGRVLVQRDGTVRLLPPPTEDLALPAIVEYPAYASPEEVRAGQPDERSALYSLGCTLFELLAGRPPYMGSDPKKVLHAHVEEAIPDVRSFAPGVPESLAVTVTELLAKDPEMRIQTPGELARRLRQVLGGGGSAPAPQRAHSTASPASTLTAPAAPAQGAPARPPQGARPRAAAAPPIITSLTPPVSPRAPVARARVPAPGRPAPRRPQPARAGGRPSPRPRTRRAGMDGEEEVEEVYVAPPSARTFGFTVVGAIVGLLLAGLLGNMKWQEKKADLEHNAAENLDQRRQTYLQTRKTNFTGNVKSEVETVDGYLNAAKAHKADRRQDDLVQNLNAHCYLPTAGRLADELVKIWTPVSLESKEEVAQADAAWEKLLAEAEKLHGEMKLGEAIAKIRENEITNKARHGSVIDKKVEEWGQEIDAKWKADDAEALKLAQGGKGPEAVAVLRKSLEYGDEQVRRDAGNRIRKLEEQLSLQAGAGKQPDAESDANGDKDKPEEKPEEKPDEKPGEKDEGGGDKADGGDK